MIIKHIEDKITQFTDSLGIRTNTAFKLYLRRLVDSVFTTIVLLFIAIIAFYVLLQGCKMVWGVYQITTVGKHYARMNPEIASLITDVISGNLLHISIYYVLATFITCLIVCTVLQLFCITRFFYEPMGMFRKTLFFGLPLAYIIGFINSESLELMMINRSFAIALFPTLMLFHHCFKNTTLFIPEIKDALTLIKKQFSAEDEKY